MLFLPHSVNILVYDSSKAGNCSFWGPAGPFQLLQQKLQNKIIVTTHSVCKTFVIAQIPILIKLLDIVSLTGNGFSLSFKAGEGQAALGTSSAEGLCWQYHLLSVLFIDHHWRDAPHVQPGFEVFFCVAAFPASNCEAWPYQNASSHCTKSMSTLKPWTILKFNVS